MASIFLSAGDLSGDVHCALLVRELLKRHPDWQIHALGANHLREAGAKILGDTRNLGVIGFVPSLQTLPRTLKMRRQSLQWLEKNRPALAILCDWGGFNTRLLPNLQRLQIPVLYYFPPRSWQKTGDGGLAIAPFVEKVATPFEWSAKRLQNSGCDAHWVGHPLLEMRPETSRDELRREFGVEKNQKLVALLPGSRALELSSIAPHVAGAAQILREKFNARFIAAAPQNGGKTLRRFLPDWISIVENRAAEVLKACHAAIVKSGTSTLEAAVADAPQVVVYDVPAVLRWQVRLTGLRRKIRFVAMPNIMLEREVIPELLGEKCRAKIIAQYLGELLEKPEIADLQRRNYQEVRRALGAELGAPATQLTADLVEQLVLR